MVYIKYVDAHTVVFGYDHWGVGGFESAPVTVEPGAEHVIGVDYGALYAAGTGSHDRVVIRLNGSIVVDRPAAFRPSPSDTVVVGANLIGASTATPVFSGNLLSRRRVRP